MMSDSRKCSSADYENMREKNYKQFISGRAQRQKFSATLEPNQVHFYIIGKFTSLGSTFY